MNIRLLLSVLLICTRATSFAHRDSVIDMGKEFDWTACRAGPNTEAIALSQPDFRVDESSAEYCVNGEAAAPATAFTVLQRNGSFAMLGLGPKHDDPFFEDNLYQAPDINATGAAFYTLTWRTSVPRKSGVTQLLHLRGVNYGVSVFANGEALPDITGSTHVEGMFRRSTYILPMCKAANVAEKCKPNAIAIRVTPPPHVGNRTSGQGGAHKLAKFTTAQFSAGWDWISSVPDRNTGLWDKVALEEIVGVAAMSNPFVSVHNIDLKDARTSPGAERGVSAVIKSKVTLNILDVVDSSKSEAKVSVEIFSLSSPSTVVGRTSLDVSLPTHQAGKAVEFTLPAIVLHEPELWYPAGYGAQPLYLANFTLSTGSSQVSSSVFQSKTSIRFGIRKVEHFLHPKTRGRTFRVNGLSIFLQGGNWIHTDQFFRYSSNAKRYSDEVKLHAQMGLNLIRVWGGGISERPEFYNAADEQGILIMQEFWMTGDNNGRWAGNYSWPEDHSIFLACVRDTVVMLRNHPSLLFWVGGNELYPAAKSPPLSIRTAVPDIIRELDQPGRFYIPSSMSNYTDYDPEYALAPKDGPYGILLDSDFYERNPGLTFWNGSRAQDLVIGFQPELGSVSTPTYESMRRFMSRDTLENHFPGIDPENSSIHHIWTFHKYISYTTSNETWRKSSNQQLERPFDHVYNFFSGNPPKSARDYASAANIVQMFQYQAMFEGFQTFMWDYYSAVIMWKSQSPWPVLRGAFYDSWLKQTGGYWGIRRALSRQIHIQLNLRSWQPTVINKGFSDYSTRAKLEVRTTLYSAMTGRLVASVSQPMPTDSVHIVKAQSVTALHEAVQFPKLSGVETSSLVRMQLVEIDNNGDIMKVLAENSYLRSDPSTSPQNYSDLGIMREARDSWVELTLDSVQLDPKSATMMIVLHADKSLSQPAHFVELDIVARGNGKAVDNRILPIFWSDNLITLLPGERRTLTAQGSRLLDRDQEEWSLEIRGWNVKPTVHALPSRPPYPVQNWYDRYHEGMTTPSRAHKLNLVLDFHAVGDGITMNTAAIQNAIRSASEWNRKNLNRGVEIVVPANSKNSVYLTAPFNLTSHLTLTIADGATLKASDDASLWPLVPPFKSYGQGRDHPGPRRVPLLGGNYLEDVVLRGPGVVDGHGQSWWARHKSQSENYTRGRLVEFVHSDGLLIENITLVNSPFWTIHPVFCSNVVARGLVILNPSDSPNTDGFDPDSTVNVSLTDSFFSVGDDGVAIKSGWDCFGIDVNRPSANIHIRNLTVNSPCCAGVCIGSEMSGGVENVLVEDLHLQSVGQGLRIKSGLGRGGYVRNVTYRNVDMQGTVDAAIEANDFYGAPNPSCHGRDAKALPTIEGITYKNIRAAGTGGVNFEGLPQRGIFGIVMDNVTVLKNGGGKVFTCSHITGTATRVVPRPCKELAPPSQT